MSEESLLAILKSDPLYTSNVLQKDSILTDKYLEVSNTISSEDTLASESVDRISSLDDVVKLTSIPEFILIKTKLWPAKRSEDMNPEIIVKDIEKLRKELSRYSWDMGNDEETLAPAIKTFYSQRRLALQKILRYSKKLKLIAEDFTSELTSSSQEFSDLIGNLAETCSQNEILRSKTEDIINLERCDTITIKNLCEYVDSVLSMFQSLDNLMKAYAYVKSYIFPVRLNIFDQKFISFISIMTVSIHCFVESLKIEYSEFHLFLLENCTKLSDS